MDVVGRKLLQLRAMGCIRQRAVPMCYYTAVDRLPCFPAAAHILYIMALIFTMACIMQSSGLNTNPHPATQLHRGAGSLFSRVIGASGFQLINVNNVPLSLRGWSQRSKLLGRNALINNLIRHYTTAAISEAHKVCSANDALCAWLSVQMRSS